LIRWFAICCTGSDNCLRCPWATRDTQKHSCAPGGGRTKSLAPPEVLSDSSQRELELGAPWPPQAQPSEPENALEMGEQHLDALSITARLLECFGLCHCAGNIAGRLVEAARDSAHRRLRTALRFERAASAIACPGPVVKCLPIAGQLAGRRQNLAGRADVNVALFVEGEVFAAEGPVFSLRLVIDRDVRRYLGFVDQPVEVGTRTVGRQRAVRA
jgi:hypothetical protein